MTAGTRLQLETRALRMLRSGWSPRDVAMETGLSTEDLAQLRRDFPSTADGRCTQPWCGHPQDGPGRPRKNSVQIKVAATPALWFCGWPCAEHHVLAQIRKATA